MIATKLAALLLKLDQAFEGLPIPAEADIVPKASRENLEYEQIRAKFKNRHWHDLSTDDLRNEADSLTLLSPEGFRFFLPAFIRATLLDYNTADLIPDVIVWKFIPSPDAAQNVYYKDRLKILTAEQKQAVRDFISFLREAHPDDFSHGELEVALNSLSL